METTSMHEEKMQKENDEAAKSKSQVKREMQSLRYLGEELVALPLVLLNKFHFSDLLLDSILLAQNSKREALRRQLQHIGKILREEDDTAIRECLRQISQPQRDEVIAFHDIEHWRDRLLAGNDKDINQAVRYFKDINRQKVRQLVRNASKERQQEKSPKSARLLFQYLTELEKI